MSNNNCPQCGAPIDPGANECKFCGEKLATQEAAQRVQQPVPQVVVQQPVPQVVVQQQPPQPQYTSGVNPSWPVKSKIAAGLLAFFFGGLGIHKFYLGKTGMGIFYLLFCWTLIPTIVGMIEGVVYLCSNDENFQLKHHVRLES